VCAMKMHSSLIWLMVMAMCLVVFTSPAVGQLPSIQDITPSIDTVVSSTTAAATAALCTYSRGFLSFDINSIASTSWYTVQDNVTVGLSYDFNVCNTVLGGSSSIIAQCPTRALGPAWQHDSAGHCSSLGGNPYSSSNVNCDSLSSSNLAAGVILHYTHGGVTTSCPNGSEFQVCLACSNTISGPTSVSHPDACTYRTTMYHPQACPLQCPRTSTGAICQARGACVSTPIGNPNPTGVGCLCFNESSLVPQPVRSDCPPPGISGDPQLVGLQGQEFQIHGVPGEIFALISQPNFQLNSRFVYLSTGRCYYNNTACWSHPGTYLGQLGFNFAAHKSNLLALSGGHGEGMRVFLGDVELYPGSESLSTPSIRAQWNISDSQVRMSHFTTDEAIIQFPTHDQLFIVASDWSIRVTNSDHFFNLNVALLQPDVMRIGSPFIRLPSSSLSSASTTNNAQLSDILPDAPIHGLIGQTWKNVEYSNGRFYEGDPFDYLIDDTDIFGSSFLFNQFIDNIQIDLDK